MKLALELAASALESSSADSSAVLANIRHCLSKIGHLRVCSCLKFKVERFV